MNLEEAIEQATGLNSRWKLRAKWVVISRESGHTLKLHGSNLNGHKIGVDYSESQIVWRPQ